LVHSGGEGGDEGRGVRAQRTPEGKGVIGGRKGEDGYAL